MFQAAGEGQGGWWEKCVWGVEGQKRSHGWVSQVAHGVWVDGGGGMAGMGCGGSYKNDFWLLVYLVFFLF